MEQVEKGKSLMKLDVFNDFCQRAIQNGILFYYSGEFSQNVVGTMSDALKQRLDSVGAPNTARRKVFSAFVEMAQNIIHYAAENGEDGAKVGALAVGEFGGKFYVICGNPVKLDHVDRLRAKLDPLRRMSLEEIKTAYREQLRNDAHETEDDISKGAGLGFLTVARESSEPIEYQIVYSSERDDGVAELYLRAVI